MAPKVELIDSGPMAESEIATKIRQGTELFNQGDFEAIRPTLADEFEMHRWLGGFDDGEVVRGPDAFIAWLKPNVFSSMNAEMLDLRGSTQMESGPIRQIPATGDTTADRARNNPRPNPDSIKQEGR